MTDLELLEEIKQAVRNIRVLRYTFKQAALGKAWDQAVQAVIAEDAAILDDLKRQMEAKIPQLLDQATHCPKCEAKIYISPTVVSCTKCSWFYVPLQVTNLFEKKEEK